MSEDKKEGVGLLGLIIALAMLIAFLAYLIYMASVYKDYIALTETTFDKEGRPIRIKESVTHGKS